MSRAAAVVATICALAAQLVCAPPLYAQSAPEAVEAPDGASVEALSSEQVIVAVTVGFYDAVLAYEGDCTGMAAMMERFLDAEGPRLSEAAKALAARAATMSETELSALAGFFAQSTADQPRFRAAQERIYPCARSSAGQPKTQRVSRQLRRFYDLHEPLLHTIVGDVE